MNTEEFIAQLKKSGLYAQCPHCEEEFKINQFVLFDGTKPFPTEALDIQQQYEDYLTTKLEDLKKRLKRATVNAKTTTKAVNLGLHFEKMLLTFKDFRWKIPDCRFLANPIDFLVFEGLSTGKIGSIDFVEVKSGNAVLNPHQKCIRDAVEDKKVKYQEFQQ